MMSNPKSKINQSECEICHEQRPTCSAYIQGIYYKNICKRCIGEGDDDISGNAASYERRRSYEDNAQDTVQPYDANGEARVEFYRLYPEAAKKVFDAATIEKLKQKI